MRKYVKHYTKEKIIIHDPELNRTDPKNNRKLKIMVEKWKCSKKRNKREWRKCESFSMLRCGFLEIARKMEKADKKKESGEVCLLEYD